MLRRDHGCRDVDQEQYEFRGRVRHHTLGDGHGIAGRLHSCVLFSRGAMSHVPFVRASRERVENEEWKDIRAVYGLKGDRTVGVIDLFRELRLLFQMLTIPCIVHQV